jgi:hypothetical protein
VAPEGNVLHTGAAVVVHKLLDLRLLLARRWLVDWHLDLNKTAIISTTLD